VLCGGRGAFALEGGQELLEGVGALGDLIRQPFGEAPLDPHEQFDALEAA
jgi:hypothetical protein